MAVIYIKPLLDGITQGHINASKEGKPYSEDELERAQKLSDRIYTANDITEYVIFLGTYEDMLKVIFEGVSSIEQFVKPSKKFILEFHSIVQSLKEYQTDIKALKDLPQFTFDEYGNLDFNITWMLEHLPQKLQEIETYRARVQQVFYDICNGDYYYAPYMENQLSQDQLLIKHHKKKRSLFHLSKELQQTSDLELPFTKRNSKKMRVYNTLKSLFDQNINTYDLSKKAKVKIDEIAAIILQLRADLKKYRPNLMIDSKNKNGYKLTHLAS